MLMWSEHGVMCDSPAAISHEVKNAPMSAILRAQCAADACGSSEVDSDENGRRSQGSVDFDVAQISFEIKC